MTTESLLVDLYPEVVNKAKDYCSICFRTGKERRLVDGINLTKFKLYRQYNHLEINGNINKLCNQKICYMCDAQAMAANRFCLAVNLSQHIHNLFTKMEKQPTFAMTVIDNLRNLGNPQREVVHNRRTVESLQTMLEQLRRNTTLLQTETLLLNNPGEDCIVERSSAEARDSLRDLLTFEPAAGLDVDDTLFHLDASENDNKQIIIEDDDPLKEEPPDQNVFIIPDPLPAPAAPPPPPPAAPPAPVAATTGYLLHPILVNNGTITIPTLDKNISINNPNLIVNGSANNTSNIFPLDRFVVTPFSQKTSKTQIVVTKSNQNSPNLNFMKNTNSLAKNIVSMVKNQSQNQNTIILEQNTQNLLQNTSNLSQNTVVLEHSTRNVQNTSNLRQQMLQAMSTAMANLPVAATKPVAAKKVTPVKVTATPVKRPDSDGNTDCQDIQPIRKPEGKIDWEDKIPMDVISFVSPSDPTTAKRPKVTYPGPSVPGLVLAPGHGDDDPRDAIAKCVITDVKSVRETEVIDLC